MRYKKKFRCVPPNALRRSLTPILDCIRFSFPHSNKLYTVFETLAAAVKWWLGI